MGRKIKVQFIIRGGKMMPLHLQCAVYLCVTEKGRVSTIRLQGNLSVVSGIRRVKGFEQYQRYQNLNCVGHLKNMLWSAKRGESRSRFLPVLRTVLKKELSYIRPLRLGLGKSRRRRKIKRRRSRASDRGQMKGGGKAGGTFLKGGWKPMKGGDGSGYQSWCQPSNAWQRNLQGEDVGVRRTSVEDNRLEVTCEEKIWLPPSKKNAKRD